MREAQTSLLATHFDSANERLRDRPRQRPIANKRCRIIRHFFSVFSRMGVAREVTAARSGSPHGGRRGGRHGPLSAAGRASSAERRRLGKRLTTRGVHAGRPPRAPMTPTPAPGTGRDRCLTIRGRRGRRKTRKILDNDPAGCYIQGRRRGHSCVRRAPPPQQCVADQTPPRHPLRQCIIKLTGYSRAISSLGSPPVLPYARSMYYIV